MNLSIFQETKEQENLQSKGVDDLMAKPPGVWILRCSRPLRKRGSYLQTNGKHPPGAIPSLGHLQFLPDAKQTMVWAIMQG